MQKHKSSSSFTPFIDPRLLQVSPSTGSALNNLGEFDPVFKGNLSASYTNQALGFDLSGYGNDARLAEALRADPSRKGSVVNVNPVNTRPQSDTPEIRKYKKRFNSEILCAALWGKNDERGEPFYLEMGSPAQINISASFLMHHPRF